MESSKRRVKLVSLIFIVSIFKIRYQKLHLSIKLYIAYRCDQQQPPNHKRQTEKIETVIDIFTCHLAKNTTAAFLFVLIVQDF